MTTDHYPPLSDGSGGRTVACDNETLLRQAPMAACTYMRCAVVDIDEMFGKGYAAKHPELIAAYMQTAALDYAGGEIARAIETLADQVSDPDGVVATALEAGVPWAYGRKTDD